MRIMSSQEIPEIAGALVHHRATSSAWKQECLEVNELLVSKDILQGDATHVLLIVDSPAQSKIALKRPETVLRSDRLSNRLSKAIGSISTSEHLQLMLFTAASMTSLNNTTCHKTLTQKYQKSSFRNT